MKRLALIGLLGLSLAACATPTAFAPAARPNGVGFSDMRIEQDRYRVTFQGGGGAPAAQVEDYALLRSAIITLDAGYDWFRVVGRRELAAGSGSTMSVGGGSGYGGRSSVGVGVGAAFDLGGGPRLSTTLEIKLGRGPTPREPDVYDARDVRRTIGGRGGTLT